MKNSIIGFVFAALAAACGGNSIELVGKTPEQQADTVATAICEKSAECGRASVDCAQTSEGIDCTGVIEPVDFDACYQQNYPGALADFTECNLTAEHVKLAEDCINAQLDMSCVSQSELDAFVAEIEAGNTDAELRPYPTACIQLDAALEIACD